MWRTRKTEQPKPRMPIDPSAFEPDANGYVELPNSTLDREGMLSLVVASEVDVVIVDGDMRENLYFQGSRGIDSDTYQDRAPERVIMLGVAGCRLVGHGIKGPYAFTEFPSAAIVDPTAIVDIMFNKYKEQ